MWAIRQALLPLTKRERARRLDNVVSGLDACSWGDDEAWQIQCHMDVLVEIVNAAGGSAKRVAFMADDAFTRLRPQPTLAEAHAAGRAEALREVVAMLDAQSAREWDTYECTHMPDDSLRGDVLADAADDVRALLTEHRPAGEKSSPD